MNTDNEITGAVGFDPACVDALSDEDLNQIAGSGNENYVSITDEQCEKIKAWYRRNPPTHHPIVVPNYGMVFPRRLFNEALSATDAL